LQTATYTQDSGSMISKRDKECCTKSLAKKLEGIWEEGDLSKGKIEYENGDIYDGELK